MQRSMPLLRRALSTAAKPRKPEYPTSFLGHLKSQKLNVFNIGVTVLTLSLSIQLVAMKQEKEAAEATNAVMAKRMAKLEARLAEFNVKVLTDEEEAAEKEAEAMRKLDRELEEKAKNAPKTKGVMI
ncbi:hypothetical protein SPRG_05043 [Saprolegnia parasitica CBS 223.65]|uniref:Uncharacterized protein n=1 Tax=Saprolegnia parasitica (strain CBS 223.65) TaxID=695850 RepID=A0A067CU65_SAPPC|nr:hypothetical protein SPRG_05043 [Saprolegnia parasitica CBS 223.65]KDO30332.1 hypothetical protein SPRG_05043 [Saprolegnia parasitica CBS 223.65]|eukprot:XP_012198942.1 hypothetical protein SPRG_05043 [Saprolegnia parasitica CBS 223.65]